MTLAGFKSKNHPQQTGKRGATDAVDDRGTDQAFFDSLSERFGGFTLDVAAASHNAKCARFYAREDDGLTQPWVGKVWSNPPYSDIRPWVDRAWEEWSAGHAELIVMLLPANRTEQGWWQDLVEPRRDRPDSPLRVEFLKGRMRFDRPQAVIGPKGDRPPFGCCLLIWMTEPQTPPTGDVATRRTGMRRFAGNPPAGANEGQRCSAFVRGDHTKGHLCGNALPCRDHTTNCDGQP